MHTEVLKNHDEWTVSHVYPSRTAEELIALGDHHFERFTGKEMVVLFQYLRALSMRQERYDEREWKELQAQLRHRDIPIAIFMDGSAEYDRISDADFGRLFRHLRTKYRDRYQPMGWKVFHKQLSIRKIHV